MKVTHSLLQCAAVTIKSSLTRNPPQIWPLLFCTETMYSIEFSGAIFPWITHAVKMSKNLNEIIVTWTGWLESNIQILSASSETCQKMKKQNFVQNMHDARQTTNLSSWGYWVNPFIQQFPFAFWHLWLLSFLSRFITTSCVQC